MCKPTSAKGERAGLKLTSTRDCLTAFNGSRVHGDIIRMAQFTVFFIYCIRFVILFCLLRNSSRLTWLRLQQPQKQRRLASPTSACWIISCFRKPPNSDLTWTTGSLTCVRRDHSYACVYPRGLGTPTTSQYNIFELGKTLTTFSNY